MHPKHFLALTFLWVVSLSSHAQVKKDEHTFVLTPPSYAGMTVQTRLAQGQDGKPVAPPQDSTPAAEAAKPPVKDIPYVVSSGSASSPAATPAAPASADAAPARANEGTPPASAISITPGQPAPTFATLQDANKAGINPLAPVKPVVKPVETDWTQRLRSLAEHHKQQLLLGGLLAALCVVAVLLARRRRASAE